MFTVIPHAKFDGNCKPVLETSERHVRQGRRRSRSPCFSCKFILNSLSQLPACLYFFHLTLPAFSTLGRPWFRHPSGPSIFWAIDSEKTTQCSVIPKCFPRVLEQVGEDMQEDEKLSSHEIDTLGSLGKACLIIC